MRDASKVEGRLTPLSQQGSQETGDERVQDCPGEVEANDPEGGTTQINGGHLR
jgi:hypothetical protein